MRRSSSLCVEHISRLRPLFVTWAFPPNEMDAAAPCGDAEVVPIGERKASVALVLESNVLVNPDFLPKASSPVFGCPVVYIELA